MDDVALLVKSLIRENPYDLLVANRKYLEFAISVLHEEHSTKALEAVMAYSFRHNHCPPNIESVLHFVRANRGHNQAFERSEAFDGQLIDIQEDTDETEVSCIGLIDDVYQKAYDLRLSFIYNMGSKIATGGNENPHTKERGPNAADEYIQEEKQKLVVKTPPEIGGDLRENMDYVETYINSFIAGKADRIYTGMKKIDAVTLIGRKQAIRWIGVLGYTHHGKSLFLATLLYNMACNGANIMLVPRESSVEDAWMSIVWLHHKNVCPERPISSKADWMRMGAGVGAEKYDTVQYILKDLRTGNSMPGTINVQPCKSWEEIEEKLKATNKKNKYDVLAIDYFGHLDAEGGNKKDSDIEKLKKSLRKAQMLSQTGIDNDQSGLVIITPLQANKTGHDAAAKREGEKFGLYENLGAVDYFTQAAHDMDCVMAVWYEGDICTESNPKQMMIQCLKGRGNMRFPTHYLKIHPETGRLMDVDETEKPTQGMETTDSLSDTDTSSVLYTTATLDIDELDI